MKVETALDRKWKLSAIGSKKRRFSAVRPDGGVVTQRTANHRTGAEIRQSFRICGKERIMSRREGKSKSGNLRRGIPERPDPLPMCDACGKVAGRFKGWFGAECQCGQPSGGFALRGAPSVGTRAPR